MLAIIFSIKAHVLLLALFEGNIPLHNHPVEQVEKSRT